MRPTIKSVIATSVLALALGSASQVNADGLTLPAGLACDFTLTIEITPSDHYVIKEWKDEDGNPVRLLTAGRGNDLAFVNEDTGAMLSLMGNGSVSHTTYNPDGSQSVSVEGHNVLIFFPTDEPPGPSTKQYVGRVLYTIESDGTWKLQNQRGTELDICAALSG